MVQKEPMMALTERGPGQPCEGETFVRLFNRQHFGPERDLRKRAVATCLYLVASGGLQWQRGRGSVPVKPGEVLVAFPERITHAVAPVHTTVYFFNLLGPSIHERLADAGLTPETPTLHNPDLLPLMERFYAIARGGHYRPYWPIRIAWNILDVMTHREPTQQRAVTTNVADLCRDIIETEFMNDLSLSQLATELDVDRSTLLRQFTKRYSQSPQDYLLETRLDHAKQRLRNPAESIKAAALACGFKDPDYFGRLFKKRNGATPGEWRRRNKAQRGA